MKKYIHVLIVLVGYALPSFASGPTDHTERFALDSSLAPFYHGVASGDPTPNSVIIWTHVTPDVPGTITGVWHVALDTSFNNVVQHGDFTTDSSRDYTVKIDVSGLQPNTWYFYEFNTGGKNSLTGRTKTAPVGDMSQLRFAFVSCSNYPVGYYNAYQAIWMKNDVDAVLHLGDYIYEGGAGTSGNTRNDQLPTYEIYRLGDYRMRYSSVKLDTSLMRLHQQFPFITVWDDHETSDNCYKDGAHGHDSTTQGPWSVRKAAAQQAYDEWLPIRLPEAGNPNKIFRTIHYGNLADIFMIDTRLYARTEQNNTYNDTANHIIGQEQLEWLKNEMINSTAKWKIIGQQVMMGPLTPFGITLNNDQWDGYAADRKKLFDVILNNNIQNVVVLTGDIHSAWAQDMPYKYNNYNPLTGAGSVGVEFVCTSVTSSSSPVALDPVYSLIKILLPYIKYVDLHKKGFGILDLTDAKAQGNLYSVNTILVPDSNFRYEAGFYTLPSTRWLKTAPSESVYTGIKEYYAPFTPRTSTVTGIKNNIKNMVLVSLYPNPFIDKIVLQYNLFQNSPVIIDIYDMSGKLVKQIDKGTQSRGLHNEELLLDNIARGTYSLVFKNNAEITERSIIKF